VFVCGDQVQVVAQVGAVLLPQFVVVVVQVLQVRTLKRGFLQHCCLQQFR
jgi:hypothetical protein